MDAITKHHYDNIRNNTIVRNDDGTISTVKTIIMGDGEREYLIPTIWEGKELSAEEAFQRAMSSDTSWPSVPAGDGAVQRLEELDRAIHEGFSDTTTPDEAEDIILDGADYPNRGLMGTLMSPRPAERPKTELSYNDLEKIARMAWAEAQGEGVEGRDAVRSVIFNRLSSSRFPDSVDEVLTAKSGKYHEFSPMDVYGSLSDIPISEDELNDQIQETIDFIQLGEDTVDGRTFFQNLEKTERSGSAFDGPDPYQIGKHTFYRGYEGQEPVTDTAFSTNIEIKYPEYAAASFALGGLSLRDATKGITTEEGRKMVKKKFQLDPSKADRNGDNNMTELEKLQAEAEQKAAVEAGDVEMDTADKAIGMACGGMMAPEEDIDPVSGNPIPLGSNPENVRDDIPAMLSQDEYVLPAHVVKWYGLQHIQEMQALAEAGLMAMSVEGLFGAEEEYEPEEGSEEDIAEDIAEGETLDEDDMSEEGMQVEIPTVQVEDELEDSEYEEAPEESKLPGMVKKQKYAFIIS